MSWNEVFRASAVEQAGLVREGQLSSEDLVQLYLERIAALNPRLSTFVQAFPKRALAAARSKDSKRRRARGALPPFHGVPIAIKDLNVVRWMPTHFGTRATPHPILPVDDRTVANLRRAGFVILGKLSTSELGAMPVTEPDIHPPTRNPWAPERSAGGSSGGSGAAVAAAMLPVAQGIRRRRLDPHSRGVLPPRRLEAFTRAAEESVRAERSPRPLHLRGADTHRQRRGSDAGRDGRPG